MGVHDDDLPPPAADLLGGYLLEALLLLDRELPHLVPVLDPAQLLRRIEHGRPEDGEGGPLYRAHGLLDDGALANPRDTDHHYAQTHGHQVCPRTPASVGENSSSCS